MGEVVGERLDDPTLEVGSRVRGQDGFAVAGRDLVEDLKALARAAGGACRVPRVRGRLLLGRGQGCPAGVGNLVIPFKPAAIAMNVYLLDPDETERQQADDAGPGFPFVPLPGVQQTKVIRQVPPVDAGLPGNVILRGHIATPQEVKDEQLRLAQPLLPRPGFPWSLRCLGPVRLDAATGGTELGG
jgi:hypothetical protein